MLLNRESYMTSIEESENDVSNEIVAFIFDKYGIDDLEDASEDELNQIFNELYGYND